jgi:exopolyphosphatase/guanosine-5'-triphosphate,3'-diphosphate pyrophosphatase
LGRELVQAAALVHDIGSMVCHTQHHKHAYHLIINSGIPGYSARELELIANVARYHQRALPKKTHANFANLHPSDRRLIRVLSGILRVAGRPRQDPHAARATRARPCEDEAVRMILQATSAPRVEIWAASRKSRLLEKAVRKRLI